MLFHRLGLEAFCHETEDPERVKKAMLNLLPFKAAEKDIKEERMDGSFGNSILSFKIYFDKQPEINGLMEFLRGNIPKEELRNFVVDEHVNDDDNFWMRFDKQKAYNGEVSLGGPDTVQLKGKVAAFPAKRERAVWMMEKFWGETI